MAEERYISGGTYYPSLQEPNDTTTGIDVRIFRPSDGFWWDWNDGTFKNAGWTTKEQALTEDDEGMWRFSTGWNLPTGEAAYKAQFEVTDASATYIVEGPSILFEISGAETYLPVFQEVIDDDVVPAGSGGVTGVECAIMRVSDGFWLDWNDETFKNAGWTTKGLALTSDDDGIWYDSTGISLPLADEEYKVQWKVDTSSSSSSSRSSSSSSSRSSSSSSSRSSSSSSSRSSSSSSRSSSSSSSRSSSSSSSLSSSSSSSRSSSSSSSRSSSSSSSSRSSSSSSRSSSSSSRSSSSRSSSSSSSVA